MPWSPWALGFLNPGLPGSSHGPLLATGWEQLWGSPRPPPPLSHPVLLDLVCRVPDTGFIGCVQIWGAAEGNAKALGRRPLGPQVGPEPKAGALSWARVSVGVPASSLSFLCLRGDKKREAPYPLGLTCQPQSALVSRKGLPVPLV